MLRYENQSDELIRNEPQELLVVQLVSLEKLLEGIGCWLISINSSLSSLREVLNGLGTPVSTPLGSYVDLGIEL